MTLGSVRVEEGRLPSPIGLTPLSWRGLFNPPKKRSLIRSFAIRMHRPRFGRGISGHKTNSPRQRRSGLLETGSSRLSGMICLPSTWQPSTDFRVLYRRRSSFPRTVATKALPYRLFEKLAVVQVNHLCSNTRRLVDVLIVDLLQEVEVDDLRGSGGSVGSFRTGELAGSVLNLLFRGAHVHEEVLC